MSANTLNTHILLQNYNNLNVAILPTKHFNEALEERVFPLNIIGNAAIEAVTLEIGQTKEIYRSEKFKATVELKRVSINVAILITGWKGVRNSSKTNKK
jgi:hypothetical protein